MAHSRDDAAKPATAQIITLRCPKRATSQPVIGVTMAVAMMFSVTTHATWSGVADSAPCSWGSTTFTTVIVSA